MLKNVKLQYRQSKNTKFEIIRKFCVHDLDYVK